MRVVQISDTHITADPADQTVLEMLGGIELTDSAANLARILEDIASLDPLPDFIAATGDLGDRGHKSSYLRLRSMLNQLPVPVYAIPGNHDLPDALDAHLPGGNVSLGHVIERNNWTFLFARSGNTEWGELGARKVAALRDAAAARQGERVFLFMHHPPVTLHQGYLPDAGFLEADVHAVIAGHDVAAISAGHVHSANELAFGAASLFTAPSTYMGAPGPGYRIFDFEGTSFSSSVRTFPELNAMTDAKRDKLMASLKPRVERMMKIVPQRDDEKHARHEVLEWQREADQRRGRQPA